MISHRCRYKARGSVLMRVFTSSSVRWVAARVTLAISSLFSFQSSPPLFYHSTRISIRPGATFSRGGLVEKQSARHGPAYLWTARRAEAHRWLRGHFWYARFRDAVL